MSEPVVITVPPGTARLYLLRRYTEADRQAVVGFDPTVDGPPDEIVGWLAPKREWVGVPELPTVDVVASEGSWYRDLRPGDPVVLAEPCPICDGVEWANVGTPFRCPDCGGGTGGVPLVSACVADDDEPAIIPVHQTVGAFADFSDWEDSILAGTPNGKPNVYGVPPKLHRLGQETGTSIAGDWSGMSWAVRVAGAENYQP